MNYIPNTDRDREELLRYIGRKSVDELFADVPAMEGGRRIDGLPAAATEAELFREMKLLSEKNAAAGEKITFLGAGSYNHFIPSAVRHVVARSEFYTAYTPYQPEMSQGLLQAVYEYQTMICRLTGMDAANASHYDGASATAEAALMACASTGKNEIAVSSAVHPEYRSVLKTYAEGAGIKITETGTEKGITGSEAADAAVNANTACLIIQSPNFFGCIENMETLAETAKEKGALFVAVADPISLGILKAPSEYGADIVTAEGQSLGNDMNYGGPGLGIMAVKQKLVRSLPGRIAGMTTDRAGKKGFVLTLQTREQHIRREKASSNICSNEALCSLAAAAYLSYVGRTGIRKIAETCLGRAQYAKKLISQIKGFSFPFAAHTFKEFVVKTPKSAEQINGSLYKKGIIGGLDLSRFYPELDSHMLFCVTEMNSRQDIELLAEALKDA